MKIAKFLYKERISWGKLDGQDLISIGNNPFSKIKLGQRKTPLKRCRLLAPATPSKIILVGLNYRDHAHELRMSIPNEPILFLKPPSSLIGTGDAIVYPKKVKQLDYEAELAIVIKKKAKNISEKEVSKYILGYTCLNDITARDLQKKDGQWSRAKSFDTFCAVGPFIETKISPLDLRIQLYLNNKLKQDSSTSNFIFSIKHIVAFISRVMTILPGDIISTGTPAGVGKMKKGDLVEVKIEGIGSLKNKVV